MAIRKMGLKNTLVKLFHISRDQWVKESLQIYCIVPIRSARRSDTTEGASIRSSDNDSTGLWPPGSLHTLGADGHI